MPSPTPYDLDIAVMQALASHAHDDAYAYRRCRARRIEAYAHRLDGDDRHAFYHRVEALTDWSCHDLHEARPGHARADVRAARFPGRPSYTIQ